MKKVFLVFAFCALAWTNGFSQTKQESIKELLSIMKQDSVVEKVFSAISLQSDLMRPNNRANDLTVADMVEKEQRKMEIDSLKQKAMTFYKRILDEEIVPLYDKYYSQAEINDYISFYKSPSGQKMLQVTPDIIKDLMTTMVKKYIPQLLQGKAAL